MLPLVELRAPFAVSRAELRDADRGAEDVDFAALDAAAHDLAVAENAAVFHGWKAAGIAGIAEASPHEPIALGDDCERYPAPRRRWPSSSCCAAGIDGPYGLALGPAAHERVLEHSEHGGVPLLDHLRKILGGPLVWAPGVEGAVVVSQRGGDFLFESGEDLSVGYDRPRRRRRPALPRGELQLPRRHPGGRLRADSLRLAAGILAGRHAGRRGVPHADGVPRSGHLGAGRAPAPRFPG